MQSVSHEHIELTVTRGRTTPPSPVQHSALPTTEAVKHEEPVAVETPIGGSGYSICCLWLCGCVCRLTSLFSPISTQDPDQSTALLSQPHDRSRCLSSCKPPRGSGILLYFVLSCCADVYIALHSYPFSIEACDSTKKSMVDVCCKFLTKTMIDADGHIKAPTAFVVYLCLFVLSVAIRIPELYSWWKGCVDNDHVSAPSNPAYGYMYTANMMKFTLALCFLSMDAIPGASFEKKSYCQEEGLRLNTTACNTAVCVHLADNATFSFFSLFFAILGVPLTSGYIVVNGVNWLRSKCNSQDSHGDEFEFKCPLQYGARF